MIKLVSNNVDNYPTTEAEYEEKPTREQLVSVISQYSNEKRTNKAVDDLLKYGEAHLDDGECTNYHLL